MKKFLTDPHYFLIKYGLAILLGIELYKFIFYVARN
jgi:hypothetical protein